MTNKTKNIFRLVGVILIMLVGAFFYHIIGTPFSKESNVQPDSEIITQQLKNVSKLVVNEAKLSQNLQLQRPKVVFDEFVYV